MLGLPLIPAMQLDALPNTSQTGIHHTLDVLAIVAIALDVLAIVAAALNVRAVVAIALDVLAVVSITCKHTVGPGDV